MTGNADVYFKALNKCRLHSPPDSKYSKRHCRSRIRYGILINSGTRMSRWQERPRNIAEQPVVNRSPNTLEKLVRISAMMISAKYTLANIENRRFNNLQGGEERRLVRSSSLTGA